MSTEKAPDAVDHAVVSAKQRRKERLRAELEELISRAGGELSRDTVEAYEVVLFAIHEELLPTLEEYSEKSLVEIDASLDDPDEWSMEILEEVANKPDSLYRELHHRSTPRAKRKIQLALKSISTAAASEDVVLDEYSGRVDAVGQSLKLGENYQRPDMDLGDPVGLVSERAGALKSLYTGGTGNGKSVALERELEDYFARNLDDRDYDFKVIDPAGLRDGENWFYDVPLQDGTLQKARRDLDLPAHFLETDRDHEIEILVPLTPDLRDRELPYDVDDDRFVVRPFTIPAADIRQSLLVSILTAKLTPEQESVIRDAYQEVNHRRNDWALVDLAEEIRSRDELKSSKRKPPIRTLRQLQNRGFIRTRACEHSLDWRDIFESTERYTVFSQSFLESTIAELIVFGYLASSIVKKRESIYGVPEAVVVMRELWKIAPHNRRQDFDERAAQLQEAIGNMLSRLFRDNRHSGVHVLADTQQPSDLLKPVREMFNRYVVFETNKRQVKDIFEWTSNDNWKAFYGTLTPEPGEASITGMVEPAMENRRIQFVGPVKYAPASHHHKLDRNVDANGWRARAKYFSPIEDCPECESSDLDRLEEAHRVECGDCGAEIEDLSAGRREELRTPHEVGVEWDFDTPTRLIINQETAGSDRPDPAMSPVAAFADRCLEYDPSSSVVRAEVKEAFNAWILDHDDVDRDEPWNFDDKSVSSRFGERLNGHFEEDLGRTTSYGEIAWKNLDFTEVGRRFLSPAEREV